MQDREGQTPADDQSEGRSAGITTSESGKTKKTHPQVNWADKVSVYILYYPPRPNLTYSSVSPWPRLILFFIQIPGPRPYLSFQSLRKKGPRPFYPFFPSGDPALGRLSQSFFPETRPSAFLSILSLSETRPSAFFFKKFLYTATVVRTTIKNNLTNLSLKYSYICTLSVNIFVELIFWIISSWYHVIRSYFRSVFDT